MLNFLAFSAYGQYSGGSGTAEDPYQIGTAADLIALGEEPNDYDKHFILTGDIDLDPNLPGRKVFEGAVVARDTNYTRSQYQGIPFSGVFDGNGFTVSHVAIRGADYLGLFGVLDSGGEVKDLGVVHANIVGTGWVVGGLVGLNRGSVTKSYGNGTVNGHRNSVAGLVALNQGSVSRSYSAGAVSGDRYVGGVVGYNEHGIITGSYSTSSVSGTRSLGGLAGYNAEGSITGCHSNGTVTGTSSYVGGLVGHNCGDVTMCCSAGEVDGRNGVGGLVGCNGNAYYLCEAEPSVTNCYSICSVTGSQVVGGLVGYNNDFASITTSYSTGTPTGETFVGGLVGAGRRDDVGVSSSFWDIETSGLATSAGGTGLTTAELKDVETYQASGWDFVGDLKDGLHELWQMPEGGGYPLLAVLTGHTRRELQGEGTRRDPYLIYNAHDLGAVYYYSPHAHYRLSAPIDLSGIHWGVSLIPWFDGTFEGNGYVISNLHIRGGSYLGLFGELDSGGEISNVHLEAVDVNGADDYAGGLVGANYGTVYNCSSTGAVSGLSSVGGLVGNNHGGITVSSSEGTVRAKGGPHVGGLVGENEGGISTSYSTSHVSGYYNVRGLVGTNNRSITASYSTGMVAGDTRVGGLAGSNDPGASIVASHSTVTVFGGTHVGGLVGENFAGAVSMSYSTGAVHGVVGFGGLVGDMYKGGTFCSFWDVETSGLATSAGGTGLTTAELKDVRTYEASGWDFVGDVKDGLHDFWQMPEGGGYPLLAVLTAYTPRHLQGEGTPGDPYLISNAHDLGAVYYHSPHAHYTLSAPIDLSGIRWGAAVTPWFGGSFEGNGHVISNLHIQGGSYLGLFGELDSGGEISNVCLEAVDVNGSGDYIGGLLSVNHSGTIRVSYTTGTINGEGEVGGLVGLNGCSMRMTTPRTWTTVAGLVVSSYSAANVSGQDSVGGLIGGNWNSTITMSHSTGLVKGFTGVGGLVGVNGGWRSVETSVMSCYSTGAVSGESCVGGLVGNNGTMTGTEASVTNCYSTGAVSGQSSVGGLVGDGFGGTVLKCYSIGAVDGTEDAGGLQGSGWGHIGGSLWDVETSGEPMSAGGIGKTTAEMQTTSTFHDAGWDFVGEGENGTEDIWTICEGIDYPRLAWEPDCFSCTHEDYL